MKSAQVKQMLVIFAVVVVALWIVDFSREFDAAALEESTSQCSHCSQRGQHAPDDAPHEHAKAGIVTSAFQPPQDATSALPTSTGWSGRVLDAAGHPVPNMRMTAWPPLSLQPEGGYSEPWRANALSDAEGRFTLCLAETLAAEQLPSEVTMTSSTHGEGHLEYFSRSVPLLPGQVVGIGDCVLGAEGSSLSGYVRDEQGRPIPQAEVYVVFTTGSVNGVTIRTDSNGYYEARGVQWSKGDTTPDCFRVYLTNIALLFPGQVVQVEPEKHYVPASGGPADFVLSFPPAPATVGPLVLTYDGAPRQRVRYVVYDTAGAILQTSPFEFALVPGRLVLPFEMTLDEASGSQPVLELYSLEENNNSYQVLPIAIDSSTAAGPLVVRSTDWRTGVELRGQIIDRDGRALANLPVFLLPNDGRPPESLHYRDSITDAFGEFGFLAVPPDSRVALSARRGNVYVKPRVLQLSAESRQFIGQLRLDEH